VSDPEFHEFPGGLRTNVDFGEFRPFALFVYPQNRTGLISPNIKPHVIPSPSRLCKALLWFSAGIYSVGFFIAYALGPILTRLDKN
jgi:hypothetical protein